VATAKKERQKERKRRRRDCKNKNLHHSGVISQQ
jgi:hypothetical protein